MRKIGVETLWGGIFGIVAIAAAIVEMALNGFEAMAIAGAVKDASGTLVTVMVLLFAIKNLLPHKEKLSIDEKIVLALDEWQQANSTMIIKSADDEKTGKYGFHMRTDIRDFYRTTPLTKNAGWFVRLPLPQKGNYTSENIRIEFHLNKGTFFDGVTLSADELKHRFDQLNKLFCDFINAKYHDFLTASGQNDLITLMLSRPIENDEDIQRMTEVLNSMFQAYLAAANVKVS